MEARVVFQDPVASVIAANVMVVVITVNSRGLFGEIFIGSLLHGVVIVLQWAQGSGIVRFLICSLLVLVSSAECMASTMGRLMDVILRLDNLRLNRLGSCKNEPMRVV